MIHKKGNCAEFGPVNVFQFKSDSVKPISCIRIKVIIIIVIIIIVIIIIIMIIIIVIIINKDLFASSIYTMALRATEKKL